ncbi:MAG: glycosyltransferase family 2 protein [Anaerolineae bacterium]|nr:glycosyltransferase family 2 protein [Anaerolineae bacterium]
MIDLAVVIVNWNTRALTLDCLSTLFADLQTSALSTQVWVVDNASHDDSVPAIRAAFPQVQLIASERNLGFGAGNNAALRAMGFANAPSPAEALPQAVYFLNSDTRTHPGATRTLFEALFHLPDAGVVGARLTYGDGSFQHSAFAFPGLAQLWFDLLPAPARLAETRLNGRYPRAQYAGEAPFPVGHTLGATMLMRREVIQQTSGFDERFHLYAEEVDWSWRIQQAGWQIYCVPRAHVTHLGGQSTGQVRPQSTLNLWESRLRLFDKHYPNWKNRLARQIIRLGMRRKSRAAEQDATLDSETRAALIAAYHQIIARSYVHA